MDRVSHPTTGQGQCTGGEKLPPAYGSHGLEVLHECLEVLVRPSAPTQEDHSTTLKWS